MSNNNVWNAGTHHQLLPFNDVNLHASDSQYAFTSPSNPAAPTLVIDRPSGDIRLTDGKISGAKRVSSIAGILGMIKLRLDKYLVIITKSKAVGKFRGATIYKIISTDLLPLRDRPLHDTDEDKYLTLLRNILKTGPMYFSYEVDLTNSFQRQASSDTSKPLWERADDRFFWNKFIATDLIDFRSGGGHTHGGYRLQQGVNHGVDPFILPVISGMLSLTRTSIKGHSLSFLLITRRSRHRTGTRYFSRGIDDQGHVSNFNETEQAIVLNDTDSSFSTGFGSSGHPSGNALADDVHVLAYVQTRGSVPVYWAEVNKLKYTPELQIRGVDSAVNAAKLHFDEQIKLYGDVYMVNLVNQKGREKRVKDAYEQITKLLQSNPVDAKGADSKSPETVHMIEASSMQNQFDRLHYVYFDFHNETKNFQWHRTQILLDQLSEPLAKGAYFHGVYSPSDRARSAEVRSIQRNVVRTNCMDCLDRTNVVQSMLGRVAINRSLQDTGVLKKGEAAEEDTKFQELFRNVWADNADTVSKSYSGTGALKTDFTRTGNRTKAGAVQDLNNSITRYVRNNFGDGPRQDAFDLFSGAFLPEGGSLLYIDRRPLLIQAVPYVLFGSVFFISVASATTRLPDSSIWPLRLLVLVFFAFALYSANFMWSHGQLYVNWPKLNPQNAAVESYQDALIKAGKDPLLGPFLRSDRGRGDGRLGVLEEGKKRTE